MQLATGPRMLAGLGLLFAGQHFLAQLDAPADVLKEIQQRWSQTGLLAALHQHPSEQTTAERYFEEITAKSGIIFSSVMWSGGRLASSETDKLSALLGPNGAGKTTVIKCIAGLVLPTQGEIRVLDVPVASAQRQAVSHIGAVLEGSRNLYWRLSAWENLLYFGGIRLVPSRKLRQRADELLTLMGLQGQKHVEVRRFSRGMQQKLAIAVALLHEPSLLLLDEPTLGLDVEAARTLERTVRELAQQRGIAIVLTTHQMDLAERLADEIFVMDGGKQLAYAPTQELLKAYDLHRQSVVVQLMSALSEEQAGRLLALLPSLSIENQGSHSATLQWTVERQSDLTLLLANLDQMQVQVDSVVYQKARLEDVFLSLTRNGGT